jgi:hypothetical protein
VLILVIAIHAMLILLAIHANPTLRIDSSTAADRIALLYLPPPPSEQQTPKASQPTSAESRVHRSKASPVAPNGSPPGPLPTVQEPAPMIDWENEAAVAAQNALKPDNYRNLSGLSPQQLKWIADNQYVPAPPGIEWRRPVLDHTPEGTLLIHLGDRCVIVPPLPMVFCKIGKVH